MAPNREDAWSLSSTRLADAGRPVTMYPVRLEDGQTICLPNSVAMIANCPHPENAKRLIDFLLSEETELQLAKSRARQIPLGAVDDARVPAEVRELQQWAKDGVYLEGAAAANQTTLDWLTREYTGQ